MTHKLAAKPKINIPHTPVLIDFLKSKSNYINSPKQFLTKNQKNV